jgi:DNA polymerase-4
MPKVSHLQLPLNEEQPQIIHIDLNSCFATVEQQARPLLRGKPLGVTNRNTEYTCVVAASVEAKALGVKVGMSFHEAKLLVPSLILIEEVGCWMRCNIGIAPNRFLAKTAAGLNKPDGLDVINSSNLRSTLSMLDLTDLTGIARHNEARLNSCGIYSPLQFLEAPAQILTRYAFRSICGEDWYRRLRGWEVDDAVFDTKTVGRQYVLDNMHPTEDEVLARLSYLCETTGIKLRYKGLCARGIFVYVRYAGGDYWYERKMFKSTFFTNLEIYRRATLLFDRRPRGEYEREIGISCYGLEVSNANQLSLLNEVNREIWLTEALDTINSQFGEFTITQATSLSAKGTVKQKIPFGSTRYFELLCNRAD